MLRNIGFFLLVLCLICSLYGFIAALVAARIRQKRLFFSARIANTQTTLLCLTASLILWYSFYVKDYSIAYVYQNSSNDLPLLYLLSAFWSSLQGSHLLWTLLLTIFSSIAHWTYARNNENIMPYISASLQGVLSWMFFLAVFYSNPFQPFFPIPENGTGMNELLQNPYMVFHPPSLFTGYTALAIPFAYSIGALCKGSFTKIWVTTVQRWTLFAWVALTLGVFLGGRWAYVELGWAGYWAWDPVENSSLIPWIFCTALIHSLMVQSKKGYLKRLTIVLAFLAFFFSFFGTFITRSGVISSVHSFAQSTVGPNYLFFISALLLIFIGLYAFKAPKISPSKDAINWDLSRETALVAAQFVFISFAAIVFLGTIYPIAAETITGIKVNVQAPYFNTFAPYIGLLLAVMMVMGHLLKYGKNKKLTVLKKIVTICALLALIPTLLFSWTGNVFQSRGFSFAIQFFGIWLCFWGILCLSYQLFTKPNRTNIQWKNFQLSSLGTYLAHIGVYVAILGFLGNYRGLDKLVTLEKNQSTEFFGYHFTFKGMRIKKEENMQLFLAPLHVKKMNQDFTTLFPARAKYPTKNELIHEIDFYSSFWHDLYVTLIDFDMKTGKQATLEIHVNPTVRLVWIGGLFLVIGGLCSLLTNLAPSIKRKEEITSSRTS